MGSFRDVEQLFQDWEDEQDLRHFRVSYEEGGLRLGMLHTHSPTSIQKSQARKRSVTVILAQRENPLIEINVFLTQCDRALMLKRAVFVPQAMHKPIRGDLGLPV